MMDLRMEKTLPLQPNKAMSNRRINKPLMERRRRARINQSLSQLKALVLQSLNKDPARYNRLEKADILEMTVNHLKNLQAQQAKCGISDPEVFAKYQAGFSQCASEISNFLNNLSDLDPKVKDSIISHVTCAAERLPPVTSDDEKMDESANIKSDTENENPESPRSSVSERPRYTAIDVDSSSDGEHSTTQSTHSSPPSACLSSPRSDSDDDKHIPQRRIVFGDFQLLIQKTSDGHCFRFPSDVRSSKGAHRIQATTVSVPCPSPERPSSPQPVTITPDINNNTSQRNYNIPQVLPLVNPWRPW